MHVNFSSAAIRPCRADCTVFPQIVLSGVGIAAPRYSWWEESSQLNWTVFVFQKNQHNTQTVIYIALLYVGTLRLKASAHAVLCLYLFLLLCQELVRLSHCFVSPSGWFLQKELVLNVFNSQLCSPAEENLWGRSAWETEQNLEHTSEGVLCFLTTNHPPSYCKVFATPGRLCGGVPMTNHFPGARTHGATQESQEIDVAWQELMAITELQVSLCCQMLSCVVIQDATYFLSSQSPHNDGADRIGF